MPTAQQVSAGSGAGWSSNLGSLLQLGADAYGVYNASQLNSNANTVYRQSNPFGGYRPTYGAQLLSLIQNPSSVTSLPGYNFLLDQGIQAIDRSAAAPGGLGLGSGGEMMQLEKYGQGLADQFYQQQVATLAHLAGADISPANPYAALQGVGQAAGSLGNSTAGLISAAGSALPGVVGLLSKLFPGSSGSSGAAQQAANSMLSDGTFMPTSGFDNFAFQSGFDPTTGTFSPPDTSDPYSLTPTSNPFDVNSGWDPTTGTFGGSPTSGFDYSSIAGPSIDTGSDLSGGGGGMDFSDMFSGFKPAGGEAAKPRNASYLSNATQLYGIGTGVASGTPTGYANAALGTARLAASNPGVTGMTGTEAGALKSYAGMGSNVLGLYQGIESGGVVGDTEAGVNAAELATKAGYLGGSSGALASKLPIVGDVLSLYEFGKNWQSGNTGSDAMQGAETGATIGSTFGPIGAVVGGVIGGAVGAVSSAFGGGRPDPETENWDKFVPAFQKNPQIASRISPAHSFQLLAGVMDAKNNSPGHSTKLEQVFGRMGENNLMNQMAGQINSAISSGKVSAAASPAELYSQVVVPWLKSNGAYVNQDATVTSNGDKNDGAMDAVLTNLISAWQSGALTSRTMVGVEGQRITNLPSYAGRSAQMLIDTLRAPLDRRNNFALS